MGRMWCCLRRRAFENDAGDRGQGMSLQLMQNSGSQRRHKRDIDCEAFRNQKVLPVKLEVEEDMVGRMKSDWTSTVPRPRQKIAGRVCEISIRVPSRIDCRSTNRADPGSPPSAGAPFRILSQFQPTISSKEVLPPGLVPYRDTSTP